MKFLFFLLTLLSSNVYADWQLVDKNSEHELYIDSSTLRRTSQGFRFTLLYNYDKPVPYGGRRDGYYSYQSYGYDEEVNCVTKESRLFSSFPFSGSMGKGLIKTNNINADWSSVFDKKKRSGIQSIFSKLCG